MTKLAWMDLKNQQIYLYRKRAQTHRLRRGFLILIYVFLGLIAVILPPLMLADGLPLIALSLLSLLPVSILI